MGNGNGEADDEELSVDEGRCADAKDARAREDKDDGDRAKTEAERACDVSAGVKTGRDVERTPQEEKGVKERRGNQTWRAISWESPENNGLVLINVTPH